MNRKSIFQLVITAMIAFGGLGLAHGVAQSQEIVNLEVDLFDVEREPIEGTSGERIRLKVFLNNDGGVPMQHVEAEQFELQINGVPQPFELIEEPQQEERLELIVLIDAGEAALERGLLAEMNASVVSLRQSLTLNDQMGIYFLHDVVAPFGESDALEFLPSRDGGGAINFINSFGPTNGEAGVPLYDALERAVFVLRDGEIEPKRRAILVITPDGESLFGGQPETSRRADLDLAVFEAQRNRIPVFTYAVGGERPEQPINLRKVARLTGGTHQNVDDGEALIAALFETRDLLKRTLFVEFELDSADQFESSVFDLVYFGGGMTAETRFGAVGGGDLAGVNRRTLTPSGGGLPWLWIGLAAAVGLFGGIALMMMRRDPSLRRASGQSAASAAAVDESEFVIPQQRRTGAQKTPKGEAREIKVQKRDGPDEIEAPVKRSKKTVVDDSFKPIVLEDEGTGQANRSSVNPSDQPVTEILDSEPEKPAPVLKKTEILDRLDLPLTQIIESEPEPERKEPPPTQLLSDIDALDADKDDE